jgi:hypothetical protein
MVSRLVPTSQGNVKLIVSLPPNTQPSPGDLIGYVTFLTSHEAESSVR